MYKEWERRQFLDFPKGELGRVLGEGKAEEEPRTHRVSVCWKLMAREARALHHTQLHYHLDVQATRKSALSLPALPVKKLSCFCTSVSSVHKQNIIISLQS